MENRCPHSGGHSPSRVLGWRAESLSTWSPDTNSQQSHCPPHTPCELTARATLSLLRRTAPCATSHQPLIHFTGHSEESDATSTQVLSQALRGSWTLALLRYILGIPGWGRSDVLPGCRAKRECGELPWAVLALECQPGDVWPVYS